MHQLAIICISVALAASVYGGPQRVKRQGGWGPPPTTTTTPGWSSPPGWSSSPGWGSSGSGTTINEEGDSQAIGLGSAIAEHSAVVTVTGNSDVPGLLSISTGSGVGLSQGTSNYQQTQINSDGSSAAYQGNSASNSGYAYDYLGGDAQGLTVQVDSAGWSAVEGEGAVAQADALNHQGPGSPGWKAPARQ